MTEKKNNEPVFVEAFKTYNHADIAFIKSLLEDNGVVYYVNNENVNLIGTLTFAEPMRVMVDSGSYESVKELLEEFRGAFGKFSPEQEDEEPGV